MDLMSKIRLVTLKIIKRVRVVAQGWNFSVHVTEAGGLPQVQPQPGLHNSRSPWSMEVLSQKAQRLITAIIIRIGE